MATHATDAYPIAAGGGRKLQRASVNWRSATRAATAKDKRSALPFSEVFRLVHENNVAEVDFNFGEFTPEEKEHLIMRAAPLSTVTRGFSAQFASSLSGDADFQLSHPAEACDDFLSHAWATERLDKWCALVYTYHFKASGVAYLLTHILGAFYCAAVAPLDRSTIGLHYQLTCVAAVTILPMVVQIAVLIYGVPSLPGLNPEPSVFLDKMCINQNHVGLKTLGINGLETFLKYSRRMVLLYDEKTYTRLWCAFESAMFSRYGDIKDFVLCPCSTARFAILMLALSHVATVLGSAVLISGLNARGWDSAEFMRALESRDHLIFYGEVLGGVMIPVYSA